MRAPDPLGHYRVREEVAAQLVTRLDRWDRRMSSARGVLFVIAALFTWLAVTTPFPPMGVLLPVVGFVGLAGYHGRVARRLDEARRAAAYARDRRARLEGSWGGESSGPRPKIPAHHPAADGLDLFARGGVFDLLGPVATPFGAAILGSWLAEQGRPAPAERQQAVRAFSQRPDIAERLVLAAADVRPVDVDTLTSWAEAPVRAPGTALRWALLALVGLTLATVGWALAGGPPLAPVGALLVQAMVAIRLRHRVQEAIHGVEPPLQALSRLAPVFRVAEDLLLAGPEDAGWISRAVGEGLVTAGTFPSRRLVTLHRLVTLLDSRRNQLFGLVAPLLLWTTQWGLALAAWRARSGPLLLAWCRALGELDALAALGRHTFEHPDDVFPEWVPLGQGAVLEADGVAHPLLGGTAVRNDVRLGPPDLLLISGSNMAGKSTLLRAVGVNVVLAMAGASVRAHRFRLTPMVVGASIGVHDSLLDGRSRFHAEVLRLREIVDLLEGDAPLLFLLDELLSGTNSADRVAGATAVLGHLLDHGAVGLVTTHDLALARACDALGTRAVQGHFEDQVVGDQMVFDYALRPGPLPRGNALGVMRLVGLPVRDG